jgi:glycosyltransferase involved in cell wall biosynthesis
MKNANDKLRVDLLCTGLDRIRRGYESFARECFDALKDHDRIDLRLYKGDGETARQERALPCSARDSVAARLIAKMTGKSGYHVEQLTFLLSYLAGPLRNDPPRVVFTSDANLANFLSRWRKRTGAGYRILYSNGGPISPPFPEYDHVQQVASPYYEEALAAGEPEGNHSLVPYGIHLPPALDRGDFAEQTISRQALGLPLDSKILLSVGYVSAYHKRMDHVVREVALVPVTRRPYLVMLGQQDRTTEQVRKLAVGLLGTGGFQIESVSYDQVSRYYAAADGFVLASLKEGFGRVLLEASMHGLACMVDDNAVMRYVLGHSGLYTSMAKAGDLAAQLQREESWDISQQSRRLRVDRVKQSFSWQALTPAYLRMLEVVAGKRPD